MKLLKSIQKLLILTSPAIHTPLPRNFWNIFCQHPWLLALIVIINVCALCTSALCRRYKLSTARVVEFWIDAARSL